MEIAVELIVCTADKCWHSHFQFVEKRNGAKMTTVQNKAIDKFLDRVHNGDLEEHYQQTEVVFVGIKDTKKVTID